jgi:hypothetical protein
MIDEEMAIPIVESFESKVTVLDAMWDPAGIYLDTPQYVSLKKEIDGSLSTIKIIAHECDLSGLADKIDGGLNGGWGYSTAVSAANELLGHLRSAETVVALRSPKGPKLAAASMHRWIWGPAAQLWDDGHHTQAVTTAASALFDGHLPAKLGLPKGTKPEELVGKAFDDASPLLTIPGYTKGTPDWTNAYQGAKFLGLSCAKLVRNLGTHNVTAGADENVLLEELAMLSRFARLVDGG